MGRIGCSCTILLFGKNDFPCGMSFSRGFPFGIEDNAYTVYFRRLEFSTQHIMELCELFMMMLLACMGEKFHMTLPL